jgi:hypothetical protein
VRRWFGFRCIGCAKWCGARAATDIRLHGSEGVTMSPSFNQDSYLLGSEIFGRSSAQFACGLTFQSPVSRSALASALAAVVRRHDSLRAGFAKSRSISRAERHLHKQVYAKTGIMAPELLSQHPGLFSQQVLDSVDIPIDERCDDQQWDYARPPLIRASVSDVSSSETLFTVSVPPVICDLTSLQVLQHELAAAYRVAAGADQQHVHDDVLQFPRFASWQKHAYWSRYFDSSVPYWQSVAERFERSSVRGGEFGFSAAPGALRDPVLESVRFDDDLVKGLTDLADLAGSSLRAVVVAVFAAWIAGELKRREVGFWLQFANRTYPGSHDAIGWFANTHMFVVHLPTELTGEGLAELVSQTYMEAERHQGIPPPCLWSKLGRAPFAKRPRVSLTMLESPIDDSSNGDMADAPPIRPAFPRQSVSAQYPDECRFVAILDNSGMTLTASSSGGHGAHVIAGWLRSLERLAGDLVALKGRQLSSLTAQATGDR